MLSMLGRQGAAKDFALGVRLDTLIEQSLAMFDRDMRYLSVSERWLKDRGGVPPARLRRRGDDRPIDRRDHSAKTAGSAWAWPWCKALSGSMGGGERRGAEPRSGKGERVHRAPAPRPVPARCFACRPGRTESLELPLARAD